MFKKVKEQGEVARLISEHGFPQKKTGIRPSGFRIPPKVLLVSGSLFAVLAISLVTGLFKFSSPKPTTLLNNSQQGSSQGTSQSAGTDDAIDSSSGDLPPAQPETLSDQVSSAVAKAKKLGHSNANQNMQLTVGLKLRNKKQLNKLLADLYNPSSPSYKQFLSADKFRGMFGPTDGQVQTVKKYFANKGFKINYVSGNNLTINVQASVAKVEKTFSTTINDYQSPEQKKFFANATPPIIPREVSGGVQTISGLDNSSAPLPRFRQVGQSEAASGKVGPKLQSVCNGPCKYEFDPSLIQSFYNLSPLTAGGYKGDGQTVGLIELDGFIASDITAYASAFSLPAPKISTVLLDGFNGSAGFNSAEDTLDIDLLLATAPNASQIVYEAPNSYPNFLDTVNRAVSDNKVQALSVSWGGCEHDLSSSYAQSFANAIAQAAAQGISVYTASGDNGVYDCGVSTVEYSVDLPSDAPYATSVGGTSVPIDTTVHPEVAWTKSGGGLSNYFQKANFQNGPGVKNQYSNGKRQVPDVSANSGTAYTIYYSDPNNTNGGAGWHGYSGTSAAAPLWAGSMAVVNQYLTSAGASRTGFISPALYHLSNASQVYPPFNDITSGSNGYPTTPGYDLVTGIGSPNVANIAYDLRKEALQQQQYQPSHLNSEQKGALNVYLLGSDGALWDSKQPKTSTTWGTWKSLGAPSGGSTPRRTAAVSQNGTQLLFMNDPSGALWVNKETAVSSNNWGGWNSLGNAPGTSLANFPLAGSNADGRVEIFEAGANHVLYHNYQTTPNGSWSGWASLGTPSGVALQGLSIITNADGRLEVFASGSDGNLWHIYQDTPNGGWTGWSSLGNPGSAIGSLVVARNADGRAEVFANGSNGIMYHVYQKAPNGGWSGWSQLSTQNGFSFSKFTGSNQGPIMGTAANGRLELFQVGTDGNIWHNAQSAPSSGWTGWANFGKPTGVNPTSLTINNNTAGGLVFVITGSDGKMWFNYQTAPNGGWNGWAKVKPPTNVSFSQVQ
jgi:kumamolisin